jgi:hypothetical protein
MHAGLFAREKRSLEMQAEDRGLGAHRGPDRRNGAARFLRMIRYQRRQQPGRSELAMRRRDGQNGLRGGRIVEQQVSAAVDLDIDEAGGKPDALRQHRDAIRNLALRNDACDR